MGDKISGETGMRLSGLLVLLFSVTVYLPVLSYDGQTEDVPSQHMLDLWAHRDFNVGHYDEVAAVRGGRGPSHMVYGWYPYWMGSAYTGFQWDLLTHISFFCLETDSQGYIINSHGWPGSWSGLIASAQTAGVTLTITCTLFDSSAINTLIGNTTYRNRLITNLVDACLAGGADGINIDFEGSSLNKLNLVSFMQDLEVALHAAIPGAHLSMATPSVDWTACFDYDELGYVCDQLIPMCYGYHWSGGDPGPVSPLTAGSVWSAYCVEWTINDYLGVGYGTTPDHLAIGLPYYGYDWLVTGDPSVYPETNGGASTSRTYSYIRSNHSAYTKEWDTHSQTPWYYYWDVSDPRQVWYDDEVSLGLKYQMAKDYNLAGIAIWALGYDGSYPELWDALSDNFSCIKDGDINVDGVISAGDAQFAFFIALEMVTPTEDEACAADCNGDGNVTAADAQAIFNAGLGLGVCVTPL